MQISIFQFSSVEGWGESLCNGLPLAVSFLSVLVWLLSDFSPHFQNFYSICFGKVTTLDPPQLFLPRTLIRKVTDFLTLHPTSLGHRLLIIIIIMSLFLLSVVLPALSLFELQYWHLVFKLLCLITVVAVYLFSAIKPAVSKLIYYFLFSYRVYLCKQWNDLRVFNDHTAMATGVRFGSNASYLASTSMDRTLKIYGP